MRPESNLPRNHFTTQNRSLESKQTSVLFIVFDTFFKVTLDYACLLLWNTNDISQISIKNSITNPKPSQTQFLTGTLFFSVFCLIFGASLMQHFLLWFLMSARNLMYDSRLGWVLVLEPFFFCLLSLLLLLLPSLSFCSVRCHVTRVVPKALIKSQSRAAAVNGDHQRPSYPISRPPNSSLDGKIAHSTAIRR